MLALPLKWPGSRGLSHLIVLELPTQITKKNFNRFECDTTYDLDCTVQQIFPRGVSPVLLRSEAAAEARPSRPDAFAWLAKELRKIPDKTWKHAHLTKVRVAFISVSFKRTLISLILKSSLLLLLLLPRCLQVFPLALLLLFSAQFLLNEELVILLCQIKPLLSSLFLQTTNFTPSFVPYPFIYCARVSNFPTQCCRILWIRHF